MPERIELVVVDSVTSDGAHIPIRPTYIASASDVITSVLQPPITNLDIFQKPILTALLATLDLTGADHIFQF
jgi:hypothetical protein